MYSYTKGFSDNSIGILETTTQTLFSTDLDAKFSVQLSAHENMLEREVDISLIIYLFV